MKKVNIELMQLYWEIGSKIEHRQRKQGWGKSVVEVLAKELQKEFPGTKGFTARNLWFMRQFYVEYSDISNLKPMVSDLLIVNLSPLVADISWTKNTVIIQKWVKPQNREQQPRQINQTPKC